MEGKVQGRTSHENQLTHPKFSRSVSSQLSKGKVHNEYIKCSIFLNKEKEWLHIQQGIFFSVFPLPMLLSLEMAQISNIPPHLNKKL